MNRNQRCQPEEMRNCHQDTSMRRTLGHTHTLTLTLTYSCWLSNSGLTGRRCCHNKVSLVTTA